jgi:murein L,D-transpeptidase YcbB/YkuD
LKRCAGKAGNDTAHFAAADILLKPGKSSPDMANIIAAIQRTGSEALKTEHAATLPPTSRRRTTRRNSSRW